MKTNLKRYTNTYLLIGELELILRERILATLSEYSKTKYDAEWFSILPSKELKKSAQRELQFGFYREVLSQKYFTELWVPATHLIFLNLPNANTLNSCQMIDNRMHYATGTRNRVCHFTFDNIHNVEHEEANLKWLINALGEIH